MIEKLRSWLNAQNKDEFSVVRFLVKGYAGLTGLCFLFIALPYFREESLSLIDQFFYAVSIVSTTGLVPTDFGTTFNFGGQLMILTFIQLGGVGYMALVSFILLKKVEDLPNLSVKLLRLEFNLPSRYPLLKFIYSIFIFTLLIESIGALFLYFGFVDAGVADPVWNAIFHSISAFCTAGFSLFSDSFSSFHQYPIITNTIIVLSLLGSIGFIVLLDFFLFFVRQKKTITLTSKIILVSTLIIWLLGALHLLISETPTDLEGWALFRAYLFQSMTAHTTVGFNSLPLGEFSSSGLFIFTILMIIGASPAGTGGGIKTTTITTLFAVLKTVLQRKQKITFFNRMIPFNVVLLACSTSLFYIVLLSLGTWIVLLTDGNTFSFIFLLFECASALSTVGISTGITGDLSAAGKLLIIALMFVGRIGVLTLGYALVHSAPPLKYTIKEEEIAI